jgi:hypothetical protein
MDRAMAILRSRAPSEELDYGFVMDCLKGYSFPRTKLTHLLKTGSLVRIKKGLYVFGSLFARQPYSREVLANLVYGPSYVSLEWALQTYGMLPERVEEITSVTLKRTRMFSTPIGRFSYAHRPPLAYSSGVVRRQLSDYQSYLIATPEKALVDLLILRRGQVSKSSELQSVLFDDLRIEEEDVQKLNLPLLKKINAAYPHSTITHLITFLSKEAHE